MSKILVIALGLSALAGVYVYAATAITTCDQDATVINNINAGNFTGSMVVYGGGSIYIGSTNVIVNAPSSIDQSQTCSSQAKSSTF